MPCDAFPRPTLNMFCQLWAQLVWVKRAEGVTARLHLTPIHFRMFAVVTPVQVLLLLSLNWNKERLFLPACATCSCVNKILRKTSRFTAPKPGRPSCGWTCQIRSPRGWRKPCLCRRRRAWAWRGGLSFAPSRTSLLTSRCPTAWSGANKPKFRSPSTTICQPAQR